jgi:dipeptidase D
MTTDRLSSLEPKSVWNYFLEITRIPRASGLEEQMRMYTINFANSHHLKYKTDSAGNIVIYKPATIKEPAPTVILQAHMDMVCEKTQDSVHNFDENPIKTQIKGDWVTAHDTTLGADNGIGMAYMFALLASKDITHPNIECLFTSDEESGLTGAKKLEVELLSGTMLINLDSEDDGEIFVGCAGGMDTTATYTTTYHPINDDRFGFQVSITGLLGGHSGDDINKGRGNAIKIISHFLFALSQETTINIHSINGGNLRNAIPRDARTKGFIPFKNKEKLRVTFNLFCAEMEEKLNATEPQFRLELETDIDAHSALSEAESQAIIKALYNCPSGVIAMSKSHPGFVETSTNLAFVRTELNKITVGTSQRSAISTEKVKIAETVAKVFDCQDAKVEQGNEYPGWEPKQDSPLLTIAQHAYEELFSQNPLTKIVHAGLECGLFSEKLPYLDIISIGPTIRDAHSPSEKLSISSTQKTWQWLLTILKNIK